MLTVLRASTKEPTKTRRPHKVRMFFWPENETVLENLFEGRHNRPHAELKKLIPEALKAAKIEGEVTKAVWSQYAGCRCPCSPGFILDFHGPFDISVTYRAID